ncbi:uncharacterized protein LOC107428155 [Ziziphus jujuba]|uniref:Uncharacterized protein LOC107428155 n=1 Tax=Ziziphus jujuba TaxID=326968 RepID=A0A6P4B6B8_ZIZJJ|nr:uncharacterized protein LOC107428155 [Ziziphus jujuba]
MSWFFNSLPSDDPPHDSSSKPPPPQSADGAVSGVQEDLSAITKSIGRQLRGFAAFIAPPPPPPQSGGDSSLEQLETQSTSLVGIRNDLEEIGGSFKSGFSLLSTNSHRAVTGISKFASNFLSFQQQNLDEEEEDNGDDDDDGVAGITDEVLHFVTEISTRPECWTDFPLSLNHDFSMSDAMREHATTIEESIPDFAALRQRLCNSMKEAKFWMIYFILLVPRLHGHDLELLSTPEILEARDVLLRKIQNNRNAEVETSEKSWTTKESQVDSKVSEAQGEDNSSKDEEAPTETTNANKGLDILDETSTKQWLDKANIDSGNSMDAQRKHESEEEISFSDLEDDDNDLSHRSSDLRQAVENSSPGGASDWVKLSGSSTEIQIGQQKSGQSKEKDSEGEESSDWLTVDDFD